MNLLNREHQSEIESAEWRQRVISELFHMISQPLTGLHCLLEVSLLKRQTADGYRRDLQSALENTSRLVEKLRQGRELAEADDPGELGRVNAAGLLQEVGMEFLPLLEGLHAKASFALSSAVWVRANPAKLRRTFFYLLDNILHDLPLGGELCLSIPPGSGTVLYLGPPGGESKETVTGSLAPLSSSVEIAQRSLRAIGACLRCHEDPDGRAFWVELPG